MKHGLNAIEVCTSWLEDRYRKYENEAGRRIIYRDYTAVWEDSKTTIEPVEFASTRWKLAEDWKAVSLQEAVGWWLGGGKVKGKRFGEPEALIISDDEFPLTKELLYDEWYIRVD